MTKRSAVQSATVPLAVVVIAGCLISFLTFGPRSAMGFFQLPVLEDNQWDRTTFGLAMAIQNLMWGLGQPVFGAIADRYGTGRVLVMSAILYALGLVTMAWAPTPLWLHIGAGALVGLGIAAGSFGILLAAFARRVSAENRSLVFGLGTAAGSAGMFVFAPLSQAMIASLGWADTLVYFAAFMGLIPIAAVALRGKPDTSAEASEFRQGVRDALAQAFAHKSYLLLTAGFFVCGFQVAFITAHFPAYISDLGLAQKWAVIAIMAIGFFNIIGCLASGVIGQRYSKRKFLTYLYIGRSIVVTIFILTPATPFTVVTFSIVMGLMWLSTVAPTNGLVAVMFGTANLGMLGGIVFLSHQIGSFLGVWLGGWLYDLYGTYEPVWWLGVALGLFAAIVHWPIEERAAPGAVHA